MYATLTCLQTHDLRLVAVALLICVVASGSSFSAFRRAYMTRGPFRAAWVGVFGVLLGCGVWATHFIAMLAYQQSMSISFDFVTTLLSLLAAVAGFGLGGGYAAKSASPRRRALGGAACGLAVAGMHFLGVSAMRLPATIVWDYGLVVASIVIGVTGAGAAFVVAGDLFRPWRSVSATLLLAGAIGGLHFTAMGAATLQPAALDVPIGAYSRQLLAVEVSGLAVMLMMAGLALLAMDRLTKAASMSGLHQALDRAPTALGFFDADRRLVFWNTAYAKVLKSYRIDAVLGLPFERTTRAGMAQEIGDNRDSGQVQSPHGAWFDVHIAGAGDAGFVAILNDISSHRELAEREAQARQVADAASSAKSAFLANMSHEIRTPLNAVLGMVQVMERDDLSPEQRQRLNVIGDQGRALLGILNSVLDLTKIEAGKFELDLHPVDLDEAVRLAADSYRSLAAQKELGFELHVGPGLEGVWMADGARLRQVLGNLMSNALKFTSQGRIALAVNLCDEGVRFEVADSGIGISPAAQKTIFDAFTQADASTTRKFGGTGLGLAICFELVRLMGGMLQVRSVEGEGSAFSFVLSLERTRAAVAGRPELELAAPEGSLRILAAEDNPTNRLILTALLEPLQAELVLVANGQEAVDACRHQSFDVVLMDVQMPVLNGVEAAMQIRADEAARGRPRIPIVALTANVMQHQLEDYFAAGMDGTVSKPIEAGKLFAAISEALPEQAAVAA